MLCVTKSSFIFTFTHVKLGLGKDLSKRKKAYNSLINQSHSQIKEFTEATLRPELSIVRDRSSIQPYQTK